jgi:hypothetical protein
MTTSEYRAAQVWLLKQSAFADIDWVDSRQAFLGTESGAG